jgi:protein TonB
MYAPQPPRALAAGSSVALVGAIFAALLFGLSVRPIVEGSAPLISLDFTTPPPPPPEQPKPREPHARKPAAKHEASPQNVRNQATPVVAPPVVQPLIPPPPVVTAPKAGIGAAANNGAANRPGPGQGAGGIGNGLGGGGRGGEGDGDGDGDSVVGPERIGGSLHYSDLPEGVLAPGEEATVEVLETIEADGRVSHCRAERSSGYRVLDNLACQLILQRFRYRPALDEAGRPVRSQEEHAETWTARER